MVNRGGPLGAHEGPLPGLVQREDYPYFIRLQPVLHLHFSWIQVRVDLVSDLVVFACIVFAVVMGDRQLVTLGVVALVIHSCITFTGYTSAIAKMWRDVEVEIV